MNSTPKQLPTNLGWETSEDTKFQNISLIPIKIGKEWKLYNRHTQKVIAGNYRVSYYDRPEWMSEYHLINEGNLYHIIDHNSKRYELGLFKSMTRVEKYFLGLGYDQQLHFFYKNELICKFENPSKNVDTAPFFDVINHEMIRLKEIETIEATEQIRVDGKNIIPEYFIEDYTNQLNKYNKAFNDKNRSQFFNQLYSIPEPISIKKYCTIKNISFDSQYIFKSTRNNNSFDSLNIIEVSFQHLFISDGFVDTNNLNENFNYVGLQNTQWKIKIDGFYFNEKLIYSFRYRLEYIEIYELNTFTTYLKFNKKPNESEYNYDFPLQTIKISQFENGLAFFKVVGTPYKLGIPNFIDVHYEFGYMDLEGNIYWNDQTDPEV